MPYQHSRRTASTTHQPRMNDPNIDALPIDDGLDEFLDREIAAIRESLADFHSI